MSFRRLVISITFVAVFTMALRVATDTDTWWHLRAGAWIVEHGRVLRTDPFSLTRQGQAWVYPGWLAQIILFETYLALGYAGLNLLTAAMVLAGFAFVWRVMEGPPLVKAFVLLLAVTASGVYWAARPHIFSFALTGAYLLCLERARSGSPRSLLALPPLMVLWANLHGGFAIGFILLGAYGLGEILELAGSVTLGGAPPREALLDARARLQPLALATAGCVVAAALNPNGPAMLLYPFKTVSIGVLQQYIEEWRSPDFHRLEAQPFLWLLLLTLVAMAYSKRRPHATEVVSLAGFAYLGFLAGRNVATFALVAAPILSRHAAEVVARAGEGKPAPSQLPEALTRRLNALLLALVVLAAAIKSYPVLTSRVNEAALEDRFPIEAVAYLRSAAPRGDLFNSYNWGGYVLWELYPVYLSFVDGRTDLFEDEILTDYLDAWRGEPGWEDTFDHWDIQVALLEPDAPLARVLEANGWQAAYEDQMAVVLVPSTDRP